MCTKVMLLKPRSYKSIYVGVVVDLTEELWRKIVDWGFGVIVLKKDKIID